MTLISAPLGSTILILATICLVHICSSSLPKYKGNLLSMHFIWISILSLTSPCWCFCLIYTLSNRSVSHPISLISLKIPISGNLGPQSQPNIHCDLRICGVPLIASVGIGQNPSLLSISFM